MSGLEWLEAASYIVTIVGLPFAIGVYFYDRRLDQQTKAKTPDSSPPSSASRRRR